MLDETGDWDRADGEGLYWIAWVGKDKQSGAIVEHYGIAHLKGRKPLMSVRIVLNFFDTLAPAFTLTAEEAARVVRRIKPLPVDVHIAPNGYKEFLGKRSKALAQEKVKRGVDQ